MSNLIKQVKKLPDTPGVYFFKHGKKILYVGKATSLRDRVRSYFHSNLVTTRGPWLAKVLDEATKISFVKTDSVLEALILEAAEIKKYQPPYNAREKDDKSFSYVVITDEAWPRVLIVHGKNLTTITYNLKTVYGPFPRGGELRAAMKLIRKIFPFRDTCTPCDSPRFDLKEAPRSNLKNQECRPCFNAQIGLCPGVCSGAISRQAYRRLISNLQLFFQGKKKRLLTKLKKEMNVESKKLNFEQANQFKKQIFALQHIQDVALIKNNKVTQHRVFGTDNFRIEAYDIAHLAGGNTVGAMVVVEAGEVKKSDYRKFKIRGTVSKSGKTNVPIDDLANLKQVLGRRFNHPEWPKPDLIVVDGNENQRRAALGILENPPYTIPVISVVKDEHHRPKHLLGDPALITTHRSSILLANAEAHRFAVAYHRKLRRLRH